MPPPFPLELRTIIPTPGAVPEWTPEELWRVMANSMQDREQVLHSLREYERCADAHRKAGEMMGAALAAQRALTEPDVEPLPALVRTRPVRRFPWSLLLLGAAPLGLLAAYSAYLTWGV